MPWFSCGMRCTCLPDHVDDREELLHRVLKRGPGEDDASFARELLAHLDQLYLFVLEPVAFIDNNEIAPGNEFLDNAVFKIAPGASVPSAMFPAE